MITKPDDIKRILTEGYDSDYVRSLYSQMRYAFGDKWVQQSGSYSAGGGKLLEVPDMTVKWLEIGQSRRILNSAFISMSRVMYAQPEATFPQVDRITGEIRKQFLKCRSQVGLHEDGEWQQEDAMAYLDGDNLGFGGVQIVLRTNPISGFQQVGIQHVPATHVLWDRHTRNPGRARWMAFVHYLPVETAVAKYGSKMNGYVRSMNQEGTMTGISPQACRVIEYYDMGIGKKGEPTRAVLASDLDGEVLEHDDNEFECIPFAHYTHFVIPGMRRPIGKIAMQMSTQEALNEIEGLMRRNMARAAVDIVSDNVDANDLEDYLSGEGEGVIRYDGTAMTTQAPLQRIPAPDVSQSVLAWQNTLERQFTTDSGQTEFDRGLQASSARTLGENQLVDARGRTQGNWSTLQVLLYHRRKYAKVLKVAEKFDRDPLTVDVDGANVDLNVVSEPSSWIGEFLSEPSQIVISEEALTVKDNKAEQLEKLQGLGSLGDLVQAGMINPRKWAEERLKVLGYDPTDWQPEAVDPNQAQMPQQPPMQAGMPQPISS